MLDVGSYAPILACLAASCWSRFAMLATLPRSLDLISLGADAAAARGVDVLRGRAAGARRARRSPPAPRCRWPARRLHRPRRAAPGAADGRIAIIGSCCRRRRSSAAAFLIACDLVARTVWPSGRIASRHRHGARLADRSFSWLLVRSMTMTARRTRRARLPPRRLSVAAPGSWRIAQPSLAAANGIVSPHSGGHRDDLRDGRRRPHRRRQQLRSLPADVARIAARRRAARSRASSASSR